MVHAIPDAPPRGVTSEPRPADDAPALRDPRLVGVPHEVVRTSLPDSPEESAALQGIPLGALLRTIVVRRGEDDHLFVLIPAGRRFDWSKVRMHLGVRRLSLPDADEALAVTGYVRYTITPFGATHAWPVIVDASVMDEPTISIGGGVRGVNIHLRPADLVTALGGEVVPVSNSEAPD